MNLTSHRVRRGIAATAIASAAILLPAAALASSAGTSAPKTAAVHRCYRDDLTAWLGVPGGQTAGSTYYQLEISNVSTQTCTLYGYPGVSALGAGGKQLGSAAGRDTSHKATLITLRPGVTSHVILQITDVGNYPPSACHPTTADALRVYAAGDYTSMKFPFSFGACAKKGPVYLHVTTTIAGTGIPGYST